MSDIRDWSPVDIDNQDPVPDGFPEGQPAKSYNDCSRAVMGGIRRKWEDKEWFDYGFDVTYLNATQFSITGNRTSEYAVGLPVRAVGTLTGTVYGIITDSSFTTDTIVTCLWDSGNLTVESDSSEQVSIGTRPIGQPISAAAVRDLNAAVFSVGELKEFAYAVDIADFPLWLRCGQDVSRTTYSKLFNKLGTLWGSGDGFETFGLPPNGRVSIGADGSTYSVGQTLGESEVTLTEPQIPPHRHTEEGVSDTGITTEGSLGIPVLQPAGNLTGFTGGGQPHNNIQPSMVVDRIIYAGE